MKSVHLKGQMQFDRWLKRYSEKNAKNYTNADKQTSFVVYGRRMK